MLAQEAGYILRFITDRDTNDLRPLLLQLLKLRRFSNARKAPTGPDIE